MMNHKLQRGFTLVIMLLSFWSCENDTTNENYKVSFTFSHKWDQSEVSRADFNTIKFKTLNGDSLSIERLRYLISDITFTKTNGELIKLNDYHLIDVTNANNLSFDLETEIPSVSYSKVSFIFGLTNDNNTDGTYADLNSASWNVPALLGGGYHFMQLDGKFINSNNNEQGYNFHAIRAVDNPGNPTFPQDTFFEVNLGALDLDKDTTLNVEMNIAEWFKAPHTWDLNILNQMLMPNSEAQILMYENGQNVFQIKNN